MWLRGLSAGLRTQRVAGLIPSQGTCLGCLRAEDAYSSLSKSRRLRATPRTQGQRQTQQPWPGRLGGSERPPIHQRVVSSLAGQGTCLGHRFGPCEATDQCLSRRCFSPSVPLSLKPVSESSGEDKKKKRLDSLFIMQ